MSTVVCIKKDGGKHGLWPSLPGCAFLTSSATYQLCDSGKPLNLYGFSYLKCKMELILVSDHRVVVRIECVNSYKT